MKTFDQLYYQQGLRLASIDLHDGQWSAIWRPGSGAQWRHSGLTLDEFKDKNTEYNDQGLGLKLPRAKSFSSS